MPNKKSLKFSNVLIIIILFISVIFLNVNKKNITYKTSYIIYYEKNRSKKATDDVFEYLDQYYELVNGAKNGECETTSSPNDSSKTGARFTTYGGESLGGTIGSVEQYEKTGAVFYDNGLAMWKGGSKATNGKVYGKAGTDYMIVATATHELMGKSGYNTTYKDIKYFHYNDTFTIGISFDGEKTHKEYNAIVLDSCGACMHWSIECHETYGPKSALEIERVKKAKGYKIDIYRRSGANAPADMGYVKDGTASNVCVGQVDLGNLRTGIDDTKLLTGKSMNDLYKANGISSLNKEIENNAKQYGYGTGKGAAAAAITLINSLKTKGYRVPYYWGGGHGDTGTGVNPNWGSSAPTRVSRGGIAYSYYGLDCSGFVSWAIRNGGCTKFGSAMAGEFYNKGADSSADKAKPGDIYVSSGHVTMVVQNNNGKIILAESSGGTGGVHFSDYSPKSGYRFRDMSSFYSSSECK